MKKHINKGTIGAIYGKQSDIKKCIIKRKTPKTKLKDYGSACPNNVFNGYWWVA